MDRTERFYKIDLLLQNHGVVPMETFLKAMQVSRATFRRDIEYMRDRLNAPIQWNKADGGYSYALGKDTPQSLPGLWFNSEEAYALLMMQSLLSQIQPRLLGPHIEPLKARLRAIIETGNHAADDVESRIRLLNVAARPVPDRFFEQVAGALLSRQRLFIRYHGREKDAVTEREVSPQRLQFHRGNWYLVAWCHMQDAMRLFSMDAMEAVDTLSKKSKAVSKKELAGFEGQGYGIFAGTEVRWAKLRFSKERARWVALEVWHPQQRVTQEADGTVVLELPFTDSRELVMDILRHGKNVKVINPHDLRDVVMSELIAALELNSDVKDMSIS